VIFISLSTSALVFLRKKAQECLVLLDSLVLEKVSEKQKVLREQRRNKCGLHYIVPSHRRGNCMEIWRL
jgi:hypothetical protein